ncbi:exostosin family protein [Tripterygium wilfordii]|uniref:Exostosin family protein n=1 Tax=Tripterygium wilfordii TaxID=458696 RepID=A0A7J7CLR1_TRIWF|nr:probable xyloglucan galactosyltransferase GT19 [Tripterygium wilfordii]KAF5734886.1 exostosin family protein [Tripterygium wilfordii]
MACKWIYTVLSIITTFLCFVSTNFPHQIAAVESDPTDCTNRWIHIRRLPTYFNLDLLSNCSEYPLYDNFCPFLANHGLGRKTHNRSRSWYRTDPLLLELTFHRRMLEYPCLTADPVDANAIYLPYYAAIDAVRYLYGPEYNNSAEQGLELYDFLKHDNPWIWKRHGGHDHFLMMARPAWDFSQEVDADPRLWGTSFLKLPAFYNVTALIVEARTWPWQEQAVPFLTSFHPPNLALLESWIRRVSNSRRSSLMLFAGGGGVAANPNIRRSIRDECENSSNVDLVNRGGYYTKMCDIVDCSNGICEHDPIRYMRPMLQSTFCLQPPGDTPTRRSTFDAIVAGCIPVFFELVSAKTQYTWHLPEELYEEFSVFIQKEDVVFKGLRIMDVLRRIPKARVRKMREKVIELMPRIIYRRHESSLGLRSRMDAFDIAVEGTLQRIGSRISGGLDQ